MSAPIVTVNPRVRNDWKVAQSHSIYVAQQPLRDTVLQLTRAARLADTEQPNFIGLNSRISTQKSYGGQYVVG